MPSVRNSVHQNSSCFHGICGTKTQPLPPKCCLKKKVTVKPVSCIPGCVCVCVLSVIYFSTDDHHTIVIIPDVMRTHLWIFVWNRTSINVSNCVNQISPLMSFLITELTWSWVFSRSMGAVTVRETTSASPAARTNVLHAPNPDAPSGNSMGIARLSPTSKTYRQKKWKITGIIL